MHSLTYTTYKCSVTNTFHTHYTSKFPCTLALPRNGPHTQRDTQCSEDEARQVVVRHVRFPRRGQPPTCLSPEGKGGRLIQQLVTRGRHFPRHLRQSPGASPTESGFQLGLSQKRFLVALRASETDSKGAVNNDTCCDRWTVVVQTNLELIYVCR